TSVYSGHIEVVLKGANADEFVLKNNRITLKRGDKRVVEIERKVPKVPAPQQGIDGKDSERRAAEWVLSMKGAIDIAGKDRLISAADDLPSGAFQLTTVGLNNNPKVTDAGLEHLKGLTNLNELRLFGTGVSEVGLEHLKGMTQLTV